MKYKVAVVGATGMVGRTMIRVLLEHNFPIKDLKLLASERSAGTNIEIEGTKYPVELATPDAFSGVDFAFFSAGTEVSRQLAPEAVKRGTIVVDNSNAFRMDPNVPLVVPEVNPGALKGHKGLIANPNCSTIQMVVALWPLHREAVLERIVVSTYQAVSGAGKAAYDELKRQSQEILSGTEITKQYLPYRNAEKHYQIAFNLLPQLDVFVEDGYTKEEIKMVNETRKIMNLPGLRVTATAVRAPVFYSHSESVNCQFQRSITVEKAKQIFSTAEGIILMDNPDELIYPMPTVASGKDEVFVGRIRKDFSIENGLNLWIVGDNIRKGAATNSIQIAQEIINRSLI